VIVALLIITRLKNKTKWYVPIYFNSSDSSFNFFFFLTISHKVALPHSIQTI